MIYSKQSVQEAIKLAKEASQAADPALRANAFEVVLAHLLKEEMPSGIEKPRAKEPGVARAASNSESQDSVFDAARVATQLEITETQVNDLYELKDDTLFLSIKPLGKTLPEQCRNLANILLVAYRFGLGLKTIPQSKILKAAEEWNINGNQFSRDLKASKYVQSKAGGRGSDPVLSLTPGPINEIADEVKLLLKI